MTSKKKILFQATAASAALAFVGIGFNAINLTTLSAEVEPISIEVNMRPEAPGDLRVMEEEAMRERAMEEHGEAIETMPDTAMGDGVSGIASAARPEMLPPDYERERKRTEIRSMDRTAAIARAEELHRRLDQPDMPPEEREATEEELGMVLERHFQPAAGEEAPSEFGEPKNGDSHGGLPYGLDINNIFNKVWGLLQALVVAWATLKFKKTKGDNIPTDSFIAKVDERLIARRKKK